MNSQVEIKQVKPILKNFTQEDIELVESKGLKFVAELRMKGLNGSPLKKTVLLVKDNNKHCYITRIERNYTTQHFTCVPNGEVLFGQIFGIQTEDGTIIYPLSTEEETHYKESFIVGGLTKETCKFKNGSPVNLYVGELNGETKIFVIHQ